MEKSVKIRLSVERIRQISLQLDMAKTYRRILGDITAPSDLRGQTTLLAADCSIQNLERQMLSIQHN